MQFAMPSPMEQAISQRLKRERGDIIERFKVDYLDSGDSTDPLAAEKRKFTQQVRSGHAGQPPRDEAGVRRRQPLRGRGQSRRHARRQRHNVHAQRRHLRWHVGRRPVRRLWHLHTGIWRTIRGRIG